MGREESPAGSFKGASDVLPAASLAHTPTLKLRASGKIGAWERQAGASQEGLSNSLLPLSNKDELSVSPPLLTSLCGLGLGIFSLGLSFPYNGENCGTYFKELLQRLHKTVLGVLVSSCTTILKSR